MKSMAKKAELSQKDASKALDAFIETVKEELAKGEQVSIIGFGTFKTRTRAAHEGRNPATGESLHIPEKTIKAFKLSSSF